MIEVFKKSHLIQNRKRARKDFENHDFLFQWVDQDITDRLSFINKDFSDVLQIGARGPRVRLKNHSIKTFVTLDSVSDYFSNDDLSVLGDPEALPFDEKSMDLVLSILDLHTVNDLPGTLLQIRKILKPDGFFLCAVLGGETLFQLRDAMSQAEIIHYGGMTPRVAPFLDKPTAGELLQRAGFNIPVIDSVVLEVTYPTLNALMIDLKGMGENTALRHRRPFFSGRKFFETAEKIYFHNHSDGEGKLVANFEIIFLSGWGPSPNQQKPARRGSANVRLADVLGTTEHAGGEQTPE